VRVDEFIDKTKCFVADIVHDGDSGELFFLFYRQLFLLTRFQSILKKERMIENKSVYYSCKFMQTWFRFLYLVGRQQSD